MSETRYYSVRRLSPYLGTVQIAEMTGARAMSPDGLTWQVQISNRVAGIGGRTRFSTHGIWRADGSGDLTGTDGTQPFIEVMQNLPRLPFALADTLELWLLDAHDGLPLALLKSGFPQAKPGRRVDVQWQASAPDDNTFVSAGLAVQQAAGAVPGNGLSHGEILTRFVMEAAGPVPRAQWFRREEDGAGIGQGGTGVEGVTASRRLPADAFPELLVRERWRDDAAADLVRDYHAHLSPSLLTHSGLRRETRQWLEHDACRRAAELYRLRHVLPEVINPEMLKVAMVEALIRHAGAEAQPQTA